MSPLRDVFIIKESRESDETARDQVNGLYNEVSRNLRSGNFKRVGLHKAVMSVEALERPLTIEFDIFKSIPKRSLGDVTVAGHPMTLCNAYYISDNAKPRIGFLFAFKEGHKGNGVPKKFETEVFMRHAELFSVCKSTFFHEAVHLFDHQRIGKKFNKMNYAEMGDEDKKVRYINDPKELNAHTQEKMERLIKSGNIGDSAQEFATKVINMWNDVSKLTPDNIRRIKKRAATTWVHLKDQENQGK